MSRDTKRPEKQTGKSAQNETGLFLSSKDFFSELVQDALTQRGVKTYPLVQTYLTELLTHYLHADNLFDEYDSSGRRVRMTLAETYLRAANSESAMKVDLMKRLADRALYISGFFGDSLQRKTVDLDYYADMGGTAYATLADWSREDLQSQVYKEFSSRFLEFADVLMHISSQAHLQSEENIMRLFETYAKTGSTVARDKLLQKGLIAVPFVASAAGKKQQ